MRQTSSLLFEAIPKYLLKVKFDFLAQSVKIYN